MSNDLGTQGERPAEGAESAPKPLAHRNPDGRSFTGRRKVRLGDVTVDGRLRFDALTRYTQDVSDDDTVDAGLDVEPGWVVRATVVDELVPACLAEELTFVTFCSGIGKRWAERRLSVTGGAGARYEVATLWICIDPTAGAPVALTEQFHDLYGSAADGRKVSARLQNPKRDAVDPNGDEGGTDGGFETVQWPLRTADYDVYDHVNNAAYWAVVEELAGRSAAPRRIRLEYGEGLGHRPSVDIESAFIDDARVLWWMVDGGVAASAMIESLSGDPYLDADPES